MSILSKAIIATTAALLTMAPAMAQGMLPDLIQVAGREPLVVPSGADTCREAVSRYGGTCRYIGGGHPSDFPNGKYGYTHQVELR